MLSPIYPGIWVRRAFHHISHSHLPKQPNYQAESITPTTFSYHHPFLGNVENQEGLSPLDTFVLTSTSSFPFFPTQSTIVSKDSVQRAAGPITTYHDGTFI